MKPFIEILPCGFHCSVIKKYTVKSLLNAPGVVTFLRGAFYKDQAIVKMILFPLSSNFIM